MKKVIRLFLLLAVIGTVTAASGTAPKRYVKPLADEIMTEAVGAGLWDWVGCGLSVAGVVGSAVAVTSPYFMPAIYFLRISLMSAMVSCGGAILG
jgi:hypothetical protein